MRVAAGEGIPYPPSCDGHPLLKGEGREEVKERYCGISTSAPRRSAET